VVVKIGHEKIPLGISAETLSLPKGSAVNQLPLIFVGDFNAGNPSDPTHAI